MPMVQLPRASGRLPPCAEPPCDEPTRFCHAGPGATTTPRALDGFRPRSRVFTRGDEKATGARPRQEGRAGRRGAPGRGRAIPGARPARLSDAEVAMEDFGLLAQRLRRHLFDDMAVVDDVDAVGEAHGGRGVLLDDEDRLAGLG